jgi:arylsulfatase A-like enzyme
MQRREFLQTLAAVTAGGDVSLPSAQAQEKSVPREGTQSGRGWNILVVVADTLRIAFLGPYGNTWVKTPTLDRLARESALFERAHPECLPTIPTRRTLHSGRRAFPFRNFQPTPWDNISLPGWQPMSSSQGTVAESLAGAGYHCGFVSDVPHYFVPANNFTRGFHQWDFVRGTAEDRYRSAAAVEMKKVEQRYAAPLLRAAQHVANLSGFEPDEMAFATPRTFRSAIQFLDENRTNPKPFYLYTDTFHPHETWEAPAKYYQLYRDPKYKGKTHLTLPYNTLYQNPQLEEALVDVRAHYAGLITMVDHWLGKLLDKLKEIGKERDTLVLFVSDHGTNFGDNLEKATGKPAACLYPGTMDIPLMVRHPQGHGAGKRFREFVYTLDVPATVCAASGTAPKEGVDGKNLLALLEGGSFAPREYLTCRYSNCVWYTDERNWYFSDIHGNNPRLFDLEADKPFAETIAKKAPERVKLAWKRILEDADGKLPEYPLRDTDKVKAPFI